MTLTDNKLQAISKEWSTIAKESVGVEQVGDAIWAYGSELACLRLYANSQGRGYVSYCRLLKSWSYYSFDFAK